MPTAERVHPSGSVVHIASRIDATQLVLNPDLVMQQFSLKIFQRRQEFLDKLIGQRVGYYDASNVLRFGEMLRTDDTHGYVRDGEYTCRVLLKKLLL